MNRYKNKIQYDATTGEVKDDRKFMSMLEDFWMPRRDGGKGTEIATLPSGQNLGEIQDIQYFQNKLFQALNVPISRLKPDDGFTLGRASEISRDELKFNKYILRIRKKFSSIFNDALKIQLISKSIIAAEDWNNINKDIRFDFIRDNYFSELKDSEILNSRIVALNAIEPYIGKYFSVDWARKNILRMSEDDVEKIDAQIKKENTAQGTVVDQSERINSTGE